MSFRVDVTLHHDRVGHWSSNGMRFETEDEAKRYANVLMGQWTAVSGYRVVKTDDGVNYSYRAGKLTGIENGVTI